MRKYKAVVIDGKKVLRSLTITGICAIIITLSLINISIVQPEIHITDSIGVKNALNEIIPAPETISGPRIGPKEQLSLGIKKGFTFLLTFDPWDNRTAVLGALPIVKVVNSTYLAKRLDDSAVLVYNPENADLGEGSPDVTPNAAGEYPITEIDSGQAKALEGTKNKILIRNETNFGINIGEMLSSSLGFNMKGSSPKVLIIHTHTTESYTPEGATVYSASSGDRSLDAQKNMIAIGEAAKEVFEANGISVIHDKTVHDHPSFNGSYANSLKTIEKHKAKHPEISIVLDLHRDAFVDEKGSKAKFVTEINGEKVAQLMFVVGTNAGGLDHPNWRENMKLALKFQNRITEKYPTLMRGVNLRKERFNGHTTPGSMIIEVGSSGNTLNEALRGIRLAAGEMADFLNTLK